MSNVIASIKASTWRSFFLENDKLKYSDSLLQKVRETATFGVAPATIFDSISKNPGIGLLCLDADGDKLLLLHHLNVLGGSWLQSETKLVALSGVDSKTVAVKIKESSIVDTKQKVPKWQDIQDALDSGTPLQHIKGVKDIFLYKNVIPVPYTLVKSFLALTSFDPENVAQAFYLTMCGNTPDQDPNSHPLQTPGANSSSGDDESTTSDQINNTTTTPDEESITPVARNRRSIESTTNHHEADPLIPWLTDFTHVFHFCYLCSIGKIEPIIYTVPSSSDIIEWHESVELTHLLRPTPSHPTISHMLSASGRSASVDDDELTVESSISLKIVT